MTLFGHSSPPENIQLRLKYWNKHLSDNLGWFLYCWQQLTRAILLMLPWSLLVRCSFLSKCHLMLFGTIHIIVWAILHPSCRFMLTLPKSLSLVIQQHFTGPGHHSPWLWFTASLQHMMTSWSPFPEWCEWLILYYWCPLHVHLRVASLLSLHTQRHTCS